jgi:hypothetical protein
LGAPFLNSADSTRANFTAAIRPATTAKAPADFKSDFDETAGECRSLYYPRKPMIPGFIVKSYDSQAIAGYRSKFRSEVSPKVSPEMR